jgi:hypothetical protein
MMKEGKEDREILGRREADFHLPEDVRGRRKNNGMKFWQDVDSWRDP